MSEVTELKSRVEAKKKQLEADLAKAKADAHGDANDAEKAIRSKLEELNSYLSDGWDNFSEGVAEKLNSWLK